MPSTYSVTLYQADFNPGEMDSSRGDFVYILAINSEEQARLALSVEAQNPTTPAALITLAQNELITALQGWAASLSSS